jgi:hypothetical protein
MKQILTLVAFLACGLAHATKSYTADECRTKGRVGQTIRLQIAYLDGRGDGGRGVLKGFVVMKACTYDKEEFGGWIAVAIPEKNLKYYLRRTGTRTRYVGNSTLVNIYKAKGVIRQTAAEGGGTVIYVELTPPGSVK